MEEDAPKRAKPRWYVPTPGRLVLALLVLASFAVAALIVGYWAAGCDDTGFLGICTFTRPALGAFLGSLVGAVGLALAIRTARPEVSLAAMWVPPVLLAFGFCVFVSMVD